METVGRLVSDIQRAASADEAVETYSSAASDRGLPEKWIRSVFGKKQSLPVLDESFDAYSQGVSIFTQIGIPKENQTHMWEAWSSLPEDVRAAWVEGFKLLDTTDPTDVASYAMLLVGLLSKNNP